MYFGKYTGNKNAPVNLKREKREQIEQAIEELEERGYTLTAEPKLISAPEGMLRTYWVAQMKRK